MYRRGLALLMGASILGVLPVSGARAQQRAGSVYRMVEGKRGRDVSTTQRATIWQARTPRYPVLGEGVYYEELLRLRPGLRLDLRIDRPDLESRQVFATDAGTIAMPELGLRDITFDQEGIYEIREDPRQLKGLALILTKGMMWLELLRGGVAVRTAGTLAHVDGTEVLFVADRDTTRGILYLREGSVSFPDYPDIRILEGQAWLLQSGLRPTFLNFLPGEEKQWRKLARYNDTSVWRKVWWQRPVFFIPAAGVVAGVLYLIIDGPGGGPSAVDIDVVIPN